MFGIIVALLLLYAGFQALNSYIYHQKQGDGTEIQPYRAALEGEYVCLSEEEECVEGLELDDGSRYAINFMLMSQIPPLIETGDRIRANGTVTPIALLSYDRWAEYNVLGIFSVTDSVEQVVQ